MLLLYPVRRQQRGHIVGRHFSRRDKFAQRGSIIRFLGFLSDQCEVAGEAIGAQCSTCRGACRARADHDKPGRIARRRGLGPFDLFRRHHDVAVTHLDGITVKAHQGRRLEDFAGRGVKGAFVPRADDMAVAERTFFQRASGVRAVGAVRVHRLAVADEQDLLAVYFDTRRMLLG
jgi:hypothetical protein